MSTVSTLTYGGLLPTFVLDEDDDDVVAVADFVVPLALLESLVCLFFRLEQNDLKLKSSDLKLIMLVLRLIDFFACINGECCCGSDS